MSISSPGIGSGIDVNSLVSQLVKAERAPSDQRFARIESAAKAQLTAFGAIKSALSGLDTQLARFTGTGSALGRKATVEKDAGFAATVTSKAAPGRYAISVESLATAQKLQSAAVGKDTALGAGTLTITAGSGDPLTVTIPAGASTLAGIRDAINTAAGGKGVTATLVRGDAGDVLTLSATAIGSEGALTITTSGGGLGVLATSGGTLTELTPAADARVVVDGISRSASGNRITDAIDGVTLDLSKAAPGTSFSLDVTNDPAPLKAAMLSLVSAYNTALSQLRSVSSYNAETQVAAALNGDAAPRGIQSSLRNAISSGFAQLSALGFKTAVDGSLSLDGAAFDAAIAADPEAVGRVFGDGATVGTTLRGTLKGLVGRDGLLDGRTAGLNERLKQLANQRERFEVRIGSVEAAYRRQFTALDGLVSQLSSTQSFLTTQLDNLAKQTSR